MVNPLEVNASSNITFTWMALSEMHEVKIIVDFQNNVTESDENNNEYTVSFLTVLPDLIVEDITWLPLDAGVGDSVSFNATIKNLGTGRAGPSHLACYISGSYSNYLDIPELEADSETTVEFQWTAPDGTYIVKIVADGDKMLTESNEDNNTTTRTISIIPPDIFIPEISWSPENPSIGDIVTFTTNMTNLGGG